MNLIFAILVMLLITELTGKKHGELQKDHGREVSLGKEKNMDMSGTLRKSFFVNEALYKPEESTICSPISALIPLGKLALAADGESLDELLGAIGVTTKSMIGNHFKPLIVELRNLPGVKLDLANKIYVSINYRLQKTFAEQTKDIFNSSVENIDFKNPSNAIEQIHSWVSSQTNGMIKHLLKPTDISVDTSAVLINAVYFNLINIPYAGDKASFLLVLPTSRTGLSELLSQLKMTPEILDSAMSRMKKTGIKLTLPTFKIESKFDLNEMYNKLGVKQIFEENSGLSEIISGGSIHISKAIQKAVIDVNEIGTEAAAATAMIMNKMAKIHRNSPLEITADRPFLFFILARRQQLFSGTLVNPK